MMDTAKDERVQRKANLTPVAPQGSGKEVKDVARQFANRANWLKHDVSRRMLSFFGPGGPWQLQHKIMCCPGPLLKDGEHPPPLKHGDMQ